MYVYKQGFYLIKYRGRGVIRSYLSNIEAKILFDLMTEEKLELESITYDIKQK
jgi:hypothetical protein